ncbi:MAG TPA: DUF3048 domain-containing protein [Bacillota bacterium]|nr:DUF3048 domain-containing protein [Bacillota bacterium]
MAARAMTAGTIVLALVLAGLSGCLWRTPSPIVLPPAIAEPAALPGEHIPCPLCGEPAEEAQVARRILAVVIDNHPLSRPQAGLVQACLVFEFPVEGGMTRLLAMYLCREAPVLLPIRSLRPYFLDWAAELDAVLAYCGGTAEALLDLARLGIAGLDEVGRGQAYFERRPGRPAPHDLESGTSRLRQAMTDFGLAYEAGRRPSGLFRFGPVSGRSGEPARNLRVTYSRLSDVEYRYDEATGHYLRLQNGVAHICAVDRSLQVTARTVLVMEVSARYVPGSAEDHLELDLVGDGGARAFSRGVVSELRWARQDRTGPTTFTLADGSDLLLEPGPVWVQIVPTGVEVEVDG